MVKLPLAVLRAAPRYTSIQSCRRIAGRRLPQPARAFATRSKLLNQQDDPSNTTSLDASPLVPPKVAEVPEISTAQHDNAAEVESLANGNPQPSSERPGKASVYGSAKRRSTRNRVEAKVDIPSWFIEKNVRQHGEPTQTSIKTTPDTRTAAEDETPKQASSPPGPDGTDPSSIDVVRHGLREDDGRGTYETNVSLFDEIVYTTAAGLRANAGGRIDALSNSKPHVVLQSPKDGAEIYLESLVRHVAEELEVDSISVDAQDIAELANENATLLPDSVLNSLRLLGFDAHVIPEDQFPPAEEGEGFEEGQDEGEEGPDSQFRTTSFPAMAGTGGPKIKPTKLSSIMKVMFPDVKSFKVVGPMSMPQSMNSFFPPSISPAGPPSPPLPSPFPSKGPNNDKELFLSIIDKFIDGANIKRRNTKTPTEPSSSEKSQSSTQSPSSELLGRGLIVHIKDYLEIKATHIGGSLLARIHEAIDRRRRLGQPIVIIGTTSSNDLMPSMSKSGFRSIQASMDDADYRTIITPCKSPEASSIFIDDAKYTTKLINCRNVLAVLQQYCTSASQLKELSLDEDLGWSSDEIYFYGLDEKVWSLEKVQRMANIAVGLLDENESLTRDHLNRALMIIDASDTSKFDWLDVERGKKPAAEPTGEQALAKKAQEARIKQLQATCNNHEKKLLNGVVDAASVNTTFADVRAPQSTIEALKTLTSLSLVRPEAFKYGVLATDKIPGLLLYGPPGTGKTLLAKAVAKESGATVLEVSGSDVFDMYVGEGEKNVRAIFSLAKKLAPCVVFIDEADAIFGSRNTSGNRTSHRELINQFLREWDGMNQLSAFIMVATNRPFDLDDAVLRRLPRRLLVDLPTEKDREMILGIHLKNEQLSSDVSLTKIAADTPFYSGSDLKNLSVAAALACVREENDAAAKHTGEETYVYPEKRTLTKAHFDLAMQEISASISEDMNSLTAIRKFDEKYGDRKGRRKKHGGWGFGTMSEKEREKLRQEEGRVRSADVVPA